VCLRETFPGLAAGSESNAVGLLLVLSPGRKVKCIINIYKSAPHNGDSFGESFLATAQGYRTPIKVKCCKRPDYIPNKLARAPQIKPESYSQSLVLINPSYFLSVLAPNTRA